MGDTPWALVTGASSGLGVEYARALARSGHNLVLVARNRDRLTSLADTLAQEFSLECEVLPADLHTSRDVARVAKRLGDESKPIRVLVNNAGYGIPGHLAESDASLERDHLAIHVTAPLELTKAALPGMLERGEGRVVFVSSVAGYLSRGSYSAHKAWGLTMARSLNATYKPRGVHVSAVAPGFTRTEFHQRMNMDITMFPGFLWLQAPYVVERSLRAVEAGRAITIPSLRYKALVAIAAVLPTKWHQAGA
jgi:short-subunit dehydrogenase